MKNLADRTPLGTQGENVADRTAASTLTLPGERRAPPFSPGTVIGGNLRIVSRIGAGGMGTVYLAVDAGLLGRSCAVKVLDNVVAGAASHGRFLAEARIMASLRHPNIVPVSRYGTDADTGFDFYVMDEYLPSREDVAHICRDVLHCSIPVTDGKQSPLTLARLIDGGRTLPEAAVTTIALQLLSAMEAAHALSPPVVHRDIKPSNILFAGDGRVVLSDFGIAKRISGEDGAATAEWTSPNAAPGTWAYSAPEQRHGGVIGIATDYYAYGLVLFRTLTGGMPNRAAALPTDIAPKVSKHWTRLFSGLLAEDPGKRLADAAQVRKTLEKIVADIGLRGQHRNYLRVAAGIAIVAVLATAVGRGLRTAPHRTTPQPARTEDRTTVTDVPDEPFDHMEWCRQYAESLREILDKAIDAPKPDEAGRIFVREGQIILSGDIQNNGHIEEIVLDGGELRFSPSAEYLRDIVARFVDFAANAADGEKSPEDLLPTMRVHFYKPISVTERGGHLDTADGEITALLSGPVRRADGVDKATLKVFGFSSIIIDRAGLDPGLRITGAGQIADIGFGGALRNRRWFDDENPL